MLQAASRRRTFLEGINVMETSIRLESEVDGVLSSMDKNYELKQKGRDVSGKKSIKYMRLQKNIKLQLKHLTNDMADKIRMDRVKAEWGLVSEVIDRFLFYMSLIIIVLFVVIMVACFLCAP